MWILLSHSSLPNLQNKRRLFSYRMEGLPTYRCCTKCFFIKYQRKSIIFIVKQPKRCRIRRNTTPFWYECDTWTWQVETPFKWKKLFLQHEGNNRNYAKDRVSPDYHRGVCTHIMYYLRICYDIWVQDVSWESLEGSL